MAAEKTGLLGLSTRITREDVEFRRWLLDVERRAILPLKWMLLLSTIIVWELTRPVFNWPEVDVFAVFFIYGCLILANHYFLAFSKIPPNQVRAFCYVSYAIDLLYVTALIYLDSLNLGATGADTTDFYVLYFLLLIRGFVLYHTATENVVVNVLIAALFVFSFWIQNRSFAFLTMQRFLVKLTLVAMVILLSWFIFDIINSQKFELLKARERLYQSERLTALGELAAGVAHEVNNPIGIISTYAEYLLRKSEETDPNREDYEVIRDEAQRCKRIVGELLQFARPSETRREPTDLRALNDDVLRFIFHDKTDSSIRVNKTYPTNLPDVLVDPVQIKQALLNVYVNAQQAFGLDDGQIDVTIDREGHEAVAIEVADDGCGLPTEDVQRVFDPFFTRKPGGSGLGLSITRRLLEANGGEIDLAPRRPRGATVTITFRSLAPTGAATPLPESPVAEV